MTQAVDAFPEHCVAPLKLKIFVVQLPLCFRETPEMEQASLAEGGKKGKRGNQPDHADHQPTPGVFFEKMDHGVKNIAYFTNFSRRQLCGSLVDPEGNILESLVSP